jgi:uncharacterized Zn finger protein
MSSRSRDLAPWTRGRARGSGEFAERWWAQRWISALESFGWASRLERGRRYARASRVLGVEIARGSVEARVQGSRFEPYRVRIEVKPLSDRQWEKVIRAMAAQAIFAAKLLAGEMPRNIEDAFRATKLSLFPASRRDLKTECNCPDPANPCKHVAAVHYVLASEFDTDPFLLFRLRGISRERILEALRERRTAQAASSVRRRARRPPAAPPEELGKLADRFWQPGGDLNAFPISVAPPAVWVALLRRLGVPSIWKAHPEVRLAVERLYAKVTERAMALAYGGKGMDSEKGGRSA